MAKIKECIFKINSNVINLDTAGLPDGESEKDEFKVRGFVKDENGEITISYVEKREESSVSCDVTVKENSVEVKRRGDVFCDMIFTVGKTHKTVYKVPPFSFDMEIRALRVESNIQKEGGSISLLYLTNIGGAEKRCRMKISRED